MASEKLVKVLSNDKMCSARRCFHNTRYIRNGSLAVVSYMSGQRLWFHQQCWDYLGVIPKIKTLKAERSFRKILLTPNSIYYEGVCRMQSMRRFVSWLI